MRFVKVFGKSRCCFFFSTYFRNRYNKLYWCGKILILTRTDFPKASSNFINRRNIVHKKTIDITLFWSTKTQNQVLKKLVKLTNSQNVKNQLQYSIYNTCKFTVR